MRGEDLGGRYASKLRLGSPPHARGRHHTRRPRRRRHGITPACAGKTLLGDFPQRVGEDHPRMRGEDDGSIWRIDLPGRITPACAGKTKFLHLSGWPNGDHPRMRGEDETAFTTILPVDGSPPHARGRPISYSLFRLPQWITPACAGKTHTHPCPRYRQNGSPPHARGRLIPILARVIGRMDHPRMRGEDVEKPGEGPHPKWITPACAGKTI